MLNKKGVAFSQIMAVIGAVLISIGIAWLLAQNWHSIPSPFKIFILLGLTFAVYVGGIILQEKEYPGCSRTASLWRLNIAKPAGLLNQATLLPIQKISRHFL